MCLHFERWLPPSLQRSTIAGDHGLHILKLFLKDQAPDNNVNLVPSTMVYKVLNMVGIATFSPMTTSSECWFMSNMSIEPLQPCIHFQGPIANNGHGRVPPINQTWASLCHIFATHYLKYFFPIFWILTII